MSLLSELSFKLRIENSQQDRQSACSLISSLPDEYSLAKILSITSILPSLLEAINPRESLALSAESASTIVSLLIRADSSISMKLFIAHNFIPSFKLVLERLYEYDFKEEKDVSSSSFLICSLYTSIVILLKHLLVEENNFNFQLLSFSMNALMKLEGDAKIPILQLLLFTKEKVEIPFDPLMIFNSHYHLLGNLLSPKAAENLDLLGFLDALKEENMIIDVLDCIEPIMMDIDGERLCHQLINLILSPSPSYSSSLLSRMYEYVLKLMIDGVEVDFVFMKKIWTFSLNLIPSIKEDLDFLCIINDLLKLIIMVDDVDYIEIDNIIEIMLVIDGYCSSKDLDDDRDIVSSLIMLLLHSGLLSDSQHYDWALKKALLLFRPQTTSINSLIAATEIIEGLKNVNVDVNDDMFNDLEWLEKFESEYPEELQYIRSVFDK